jgi:hypothetical protein
MKVTKVCIKKALRTFIQSAVAYVAVNIAIVDFSDGKEALKSTLIGLAVSSLAAGLSAVMNLEKKGDC